MEEDIIECKPGIGPFKGIGSVNILRSWHAI
jgi:hypothetical protein